MATVNAAPRSIILSAAEDLFHFAQDELRGGPFSFCLRLTASNLGSHSETTSAPPAWIGTFYFAGRDTSHFAATLPCGELAGARTQ